MQTLHLADDLFPALRAGVKRATVRSGKREIFPGPLRFMSPSGQHPVVEVRVVEVSWKRLASLTDAEARLDGCATAAELRDLLQRFYPDLQDTDWITVILYDPPTT